MSKPTGCLWIMRKPRPEPEYTPEELADPQFEPWYPESPEDCYVDVECGNAIVPDARYPMCTWHLGAMEMDGREFESLVDSGHSWSGC